MKRIGNADTIADMEFVLDTPRFFDTRHTWTVDGVDCARSRYRFSGASYEFHIEVVELRRAHGGPKSWRALLVSELWRTTDTGTEIRNSKWLKVLSGRPSEITAWMRNRRSRKLDEAFRADFSAGIGARPKPLDRGES
jgi:hypothetical protein